MIYLDNNATTFLDPRVADVIKEHMDLQLGNASSMHQSGQKARQLLVDARRCIADIFGVASEELCFTSSATEAMNLLLSPQKRPLHVIASSLEHPATLASLKRLESQGSRISYLSPNEGRGAITVAQIESALREETQLIVMMAANNETGIKSDIAAMAALAEKRAIPFVVDGVASFGKEVFSMPTGVSAFCISGHKIHAPKGIALAVIRKSYKVTPLIVGGPQQFLRRAGTEDLVGIMALAKAIELAGECDIESVAALRDYFEDTLKAALPGIVIHGKEELRVSNVSNISFIGFDAESMVIALDLEGLCVSHGAACSSGALEPSHVLQQMALSREVIRSAIRFSLSRFTTKQELTDAIALIRRLVT